MLKVKVKVETIETFPVESSLKMALEDLRQLTKCQMCRENHEELKILKCFHVYCERCLKEHVKQDDQGKTFNCPSCKTNIALPRCGDFSSLETSSLHAHISKILSFAAASEAKALLTCSCKKRNPPTSYCSKCVRYLCDQCFDAHELLTEGHRVLDLTELQNQDYSLLFRQSSFCAKPEHSAEILKFYCNTCHSCICQDCLLLDHQGGHDISDLERTAERQNGTLQEKIRELEEKEAAEKENMKFFEGLVSTAKLVAENAKTKVVRAAEELIYFVEENKKDLIKQIDDELLCVFVRKNEQECIMQQLRSAKEYLAKLAEYSTALLIMNNKDSIQARLEELCAIQADINIIGHDFEFTPSSEIYKLQEAGLGSLKKVISIDSQKSRVTLDTAPQNVQALNKIAVNIVTKDFSGKNLTRNVDVSIEPEEDVKYSKLSENIDGKSCFEFVPKVPGHFTVSVTTNGKHLYNSPMKLDVKPQAMTVSGEFMFAGINEPTRSPLGIAVNRSNTKIVVTGIVSNAVAVFNHKGVLLNKISITGKRNKKLNGPMGVAFLTDEDIAVADCLNHRMVIFNTSTGSITKTFGKHGERPGEFKSPESVHVDDQKNIIVCDSTRVQVFTAVGDYLFELDTSSFGDNFHPSGAVSRGNLFFVSDSTYANSVIHVVQHQEGVVSTSSVIGVPGSGDGELRRPHGLVIDCDDNLMVCDFSNNRIEKFTLEGKFVGRTHGSIRSPGFLTLLADGRVLVTEICSTRTMII